MYYRDYRDKTDTAQLRVKGGVAWGTSIWARKKVISLAEASPGSLPGGGSIWAIFWRMSRSSLGKRLFSWMSWFSVAAAKSLQSCPTLCNPRDDSPSGSSVPGILQARTLEWVAISFSNAWKWKVKVKSLSGVWLLATPWTAAYQAPLSMGFSRQEYWSGVPLPSPWFSVTHIYFPMLPQRHSPWISHTLTPSPQILLFRSTTSNLLPTGIHRLLGIPLRSYQGNHRRANCSGPLFPCFF